MTEVLETEEYALNSLSKTSLKPQFKDEEEDEELKRLLLPDISTLPLSPPSVVETNFVRYFAVDFMKPGHDQYVYRHANGLCVIGLAQTHVALQTEGGVTSVDFNVGKSDRSEFKVTGKRKKAQNMWHATNNSVIAHQGFGAVTAVLASDINAQHFQPNSILCNVYIGDSPYVVRCCVKGSLLEVNNRLIQNPELLNTSADRDGYIAIVMPKPGDWLKIKESLVTFDEFKKLRNLS